MPIDIGLPAVAANTKFTVAITPESPRRWPFDGGSRLLLRGPSLDCVARHQLEDLWDGRRPPGAPLARPWALWAARFANGGPKLLA